MSTFNRAWRGLRAICGAALAVVCVAAASATAVAGTAYARFIDTGLGAAPGRRSTWWPLIGAIQQSIDSVKADQIPEAAPIGSLLGNNCYVGMGLMGSPFRDSLNCNSNTGNTNGDSRKNDRLNS